MDAFSKVIPKKIKLSDYTTERTLGTGSFGRVKLGKNKSTGKFVAIKILKKAEIIKLKQVDHIMNEIKILTLIDHPFLVYLLFNSFRFTRMDLLRIKNTFTLS